MMDQTLRGLNDFVSVYLDDIVIHSSTWKEHLVHKQILESRKTTRRWIHRRFIRDFAQIAESLTNLTKKGLPETIE